MYLDVVPGSALTAFYGVRLGLAQGPLAIRAIPLPSNPAVGLVMERLDINE